MIPITVFILVMFSSTASVTSVSGISSRYECETAGMAFKKATGPRSGFVCLEVEVLK